MPEEDIECDEKRRKERLKEMEGKLKKLNRDSKTAYNFTTEMAGLELAWTLANDGGTWIPAERIGWNARRHIFGSLLAQAGASPNKIVSWVGYSLDVFWKHYGNMVPRDKHDDETNLQ